MKIYSGFTLIELLVVITIIVILLALLVPSLEKAIYQAELAQCGASLKAVATGAQTYAFDHKRTYPNRPGSLEDTNTTSYEPFKLANKAQSNNPTEVRDLRPIIKDYIGTKLLICPMAGDLDLSEQATAASQHIYGGYNLFFGFQYKDHKGMKRVGDRFTWTDSGKIDAYNVLASDIDFVKVPGDGYSMGSHPDKAGLMALRTWQNYEPISGMGLPAPVGTYTSSLWFKDGFGSPERGDIDLNVARDDGSVVRYLDLASHDEKDYEVGRLPVHDNPWTWANEWYNLPKR